MTSLPSLRHLVPDYRYDGAPARTWRSYQEIIEAAIADAPRSQQTRIGPSELGIDCPRCLAHKLAGVPEKRDAAWLPFVGTAIHSRLDDVFTAYNDANDLRFLTELTVSVGDVNGQDITGHLDVYDLMTAGITDWKCVGKTTLTNVKRHGPSNQYRIQGHLYGRGAARRGLPVREVRIAYLPRNEPSLSNAVIHCEPYDEQIALDALSRADAIAKAIAAIGIEAFVVNLPPTQGCYSCARYPLPDGRTPPVPGHDTSRQLDGLIAPDAARAGSNAA